MGKLVIISAICLIFGAYYNFLFASDNGGDSDLKLVTVSGQVFDNGTGEALAGVLVRINESGKRIYTDLEGKFIIPEVMAGKYSLSASLISYESKELRIDLNGDEQDIIRIDLHQISTR